MSAPRLRSVPGKAKDVLSELGRILPSATFKPLLDYKICIDDKITERVTSIVTQFPPPEHLSNFEVRVAVVRFEKSASIPVPPGSRAIIVPVDLVSSGAQVAGRSLSLGQYLEIDQEEQASPDFYALLFFYQNSD